MAPSRWGPQTLGDVGESLLQCVAVCGSVLQCVAVCCSVLQCVTMYLFGDFSGTHIHTHTYARAHARAHTHTGCR